MRRKIIVILGPPGAGKGTQTARVAKKMDLTHISTGELLRKHIADSKDLAKYAAEVMVKGGLVDDKTALNVVFETLDAIPGRGCVFDGFPRNLNQARAFDAYLGECGDGIGCVVNIDVSDGDIVDRISGRLTCPLCEAVYHERHNPPKTAGVCGVCGGALTKRPDDNEVSVRNRLTVYREMTKPLTGYYAEKGLLKTVDGSSGADEVTESVFRLLGV